MNLFGLGPLEILLILIIALIVFGPAKLPEIMGQVGRAIADFRRTTSALSDEFNRTIAAEIQETRALVDDTKSTVTGVHTSITSAITGVPAPIRTAAPGDSVAAANSTNGTNGSASAPVTPPLADTSQWSWERSGPEPTQPAVEVNATASAAPTATVDAVPRTPPPPVRKASARNELLPPY
jgi:TatA/E family protein of Tat protein translocase